MSACFFLKFSFKFGFTYSEKQSLLDVFTVQDYRNTALPSLTPSLLPSVITVGS